MERPLSRRWTRYLRAPTRRSLPAAEKKKDFWDKAPIVTSILSSVVIAVVGLYVSSAFQKGQLAATRENNIAQLAITTQRNQADIRIAELKLASDLLESLVSADPKKRRVATMMLPAALSNQQMCQQILAALTDDPDAGVRFAAINKLGTSSTQQAALTLEKVHTDLARPPDERNLARDLATRVSLNTNLPANTAFLFASAPGGMAYESRSLNGGIFTYFLVKGLEGAADLNSDGIVTIEELAKYVEAQVPLATLDTLDATKGIARLSPILRGPGDQFKPFLELSGSPDLEVVPLGRQDKKKRAGIVIGVSDYAQAELQLRFARNDAENIATAFRKFGVETTTLVNPTGAEISLTLKRIVTSLSTDDEFYFYFSGHGWSASGENMLGPADIKRAETGITGGISIEQLKGLLRAQRLAASFAFFDVCRNEVVVSR